MANGAVYGDDGEVHHIHDRKLDALEDLIEAAKESRFLWRTGSSTTWSGYRQG